MASDGSIGIVTSLSNVPETFYSHRPLFMTFATFPYKAPRWPLFLMDVNVNLQHFAPATFPFRPQYL